MQGTMTETESSAIPTGDQKPSVAEVLKKARVLISAPERWVCDPYANGWHGRECMLTSIGGAAEGDFHLQERAEKALERVVPNIIDFNDSHTHAEVLAAFDRAIELATNSETGSPVARSQSNVQSLSKES